jgi:hypothetical protein
MLAGRKTLKISIIETNDRRGIGSFMNFGCVYSQKIAASPQGSAPSLVLHPTPKPAEGPNSSSPEQATERDGRSGSMGVRIGGKGSVLIPRLQNGHLHRNPRSHQNANLISFRKKRCYRISILSANPRTTQNAFFCIPHFVLHISFPSPQENCSLTIKESFYLLRVFQVRTRNSTNHPWQTVIKARGAGEKRGPSPKSFLMACGEEIRG